MSEMQEKYFKKWIKILKKTFLYFLKIMQTKERFERKNV